MGDPSARPGIFSLSIALQILALAAPFYMQIVIDDGIARGDADLPHRSCARLRIADGDISYIIGTSILYYINTFEYITIPDGCPPVPAFNPATAILF